MTSPLLLRPTTTEEVQAAVARAGREGLVLGLRGAEQNGVDEMLNLSALARIEAIDETSGLVTAQCGASLRSIEEALGHRGWTLELSQATLERTVGAMIAAPRPGEGSPRHGVPGSSCVGLKAVLADAKLVETRVVPRRATGPNLRHLFMGTGGALGIVVEGTLRIYRRGETQMSAAFTFGAPKDALATALRLLMEGARPLELIVRLGPVAALLAHLTGPKALVEAEQKLLDQLAKANRGQTDSTSETGQRGEGNEKKSRALDWAELPFDWPPGRRGHLIGWHRRGAALADPTLDAPEGAHALPNLFREVAARVGAASRFVGSPEAV